MADRKKSNRRREESDQTPQPAASQTQAKIKEFTEVGGSPMPGLTLRRVLRGHTDAIGRIAWSPDGKYLAVPSGNLIYIWNVESGEIVTVLEGHDKSVWVTSWSPDGRRLASGSTDKTLRIWDTASWKSVSILKGSRDTIGSIGWSPDSRIIAAGIHNVEEGLLLWDVTTGSVIRKHNVGSYVRMVAWSPDGSVLAFSGGKQEVHLWDFGSGITLLKLENEDWSWCIAWSSDGEVVAAGMGSEDRTIRIWDAKAGKLTNVLEGHSSYVMTVSFSADRRLLASKSTDQTVKLWRTDVWSMVADMPEVCQNSVNTSLAFHPSLPVLATLGEKDRVIRIWDVNVDALMGAPAVAESVRYTTAKLVLVGDSGVGKTGLGWRLAHGEFKEHPSTHGQQFWVVDELRAKRKDGTECEAVLWDLAGQPVYRPVHAIFLDDVDLAFILFDPTNRQEPLKGAQFWLEQLAGKKQLPPAVLVGARTDRGSAVVSRQEMEQFCKRYGISGGYIATSAMTGEGLGELLETVKAQIPWEQMTTTVTTLTFKNIKRYVLELKEKPDRRGVLVLPGELRARLEATDEEWEFTDAEMMTAVRHLSNHGYVSVLRSSSGEEVILLTPELLVDLASSIVLQADKHPRDLGAMSETELLRGGYAFPELSTLERSERQILLDVAVVRFLSHNICFRETLGAEALLIFPGLIKQKRPLLDEVETADDVSYIVRGRVENVYAALVVLLGYTQTFTRVNQWQSQAQYQMGDGEICGFRLAEEREGQIELVLYYSAAMPTYGRTVFQGLFEQFLYQRDVEVTRFPPVVCPNGHRQERALVVRLMREGKEFLFCAECGERASMPEIEKPLALGARDSRRVRRDGALAQLRSTYETHLVRVKAFRRDREAPRCFISHTPERADWAAQLARDLRDADVFVVEERGQARADDFVIVVGTPAYRKAWERREGAVAADAEAVRARLSNARDSWPTVIPLLAEGDAGASFPAELHSYNFGDFRDETRYAPRLFDLALTLYAIPHNHPAFVPLRENLRAQWEQTLKGMADAGREVYISYAWGGESEKVADELERAFSSRGVEIVRDKNDLGYKGRIGAFMEAIGRGRRVVLVISDKYLKSPNCLFELVHVAAGGRLTERVFPVVLGDARIYDPVERIGYVKYWEQRRDQLDEAMRDVSSYNLEGFREDIDLYDEIRDLLPRLTDVLKDMNALTPETHHSSDFSTLFDAVMNSLSD